MRIYRLEELREGLSTPTAVCLGVFDGLHLGHQKLIEAAQTVAAEKGLEALLHTYDPLPASVIQPQKWVPELTSLAERLRLAEGCGLKLAAVSRFDSALQHQSGSDFFHQVLLGKLNARHVVVGFNHRFGYQGDTNTDKLAALCKQAGIGLTVVAPVSIKDGSLISSTAIRAAILLEDFELAAQMLGRPVDKDMVSRLLPDTQLTR